MNPTLLSAWRTTLRADPTALALVDATAGVRVTRAELAARAEAWLDTYGGGLAGQTVVLAEVNGPEWLRIFLGLLEASAVIAPLDPGEPLAAQLATAAYCADIDVIATTPVGTRLPKVFTDAMVRLVDEDTRGESWHRDIEMVPVALLSAVVGSGGVEDGVSVQATGIRPEAPAATELTVRSAM